MNILNEKDGLEKTISQSVLSFSKSQEDLHQRTKIENSPIIYETNNFLSIVHTNSSYATPTEDYMKPRSERSYRLQHSYNEVKFSVFNNKLKIKVIKSDYYEGEDSLKKSRTSFLQANFAGRFVNNISYDTLPIIEKFLNRHFGNLGFISEEEKDVISDLRNELSFFNSSSLSDNNKIEILSCVLRLVNISFPIYSYYLKNGSYDERLDDGYYAFNRKNEENLDFHEALTYRDFLILSVGAYNKNIAKSLISMKIKDFLVIASFAKYVNIEALLHIYNMTKNIAIENSFFYDLEPLKHFPESILKRLFIDSLTNTQYEVNIQEDALIMSSSIPNSEMKKCVNWQELHDIGLTYYYSDSSDTNSDNDSSKNIVYPSNFMDFFKENINGLIINPLMNPKHFLMTGKEMKVCVGTPSYISRAYKGQAYCFRLDNTDNTPYALVEVSKVGLNKWVINQLNGFQNKSLQDELLIPLKVVMSKYIQMKG